MPALAIQSVNLHFGGLQVLRDITINFPEQGVCAIVGPNGAGKSSLFNCITGLYRQQSGSITLDSSEIGDLRPHQIARLGIARTFQNLAYVKSLSVLENVMLAGFAHHPYRPVMSMFGLVNRDWAGVRERSLDLLEEFDLADIAHERMAGLPFGTQKRVELARAMVTKPQILLVDESAGGLNNEEVDELGQRFKQLTETNDLLVVMIEHHMGLVRNVADQVFVLDGGVKIAEGTAVQVTNDPAVIAAYIGVE